VVELVEELPDIEDEELVLVDVQEVELLVVEEVDVE
jgi:hypothetical protein